MLVVRQETDAVFVVEADIVCTVRDNGRKASFMFASLYAVNKDRCPMGNVPKAQDDITRCVRITMESCFVPEVPA